MATKNVHTFWQLLTILVAILAIALVSCDPIAGDAGTYAEPTPNVWGETVAGDLAQVTEARQTREAR